MHRKSFFDSKICDIWQESAPNLVRISVTQNTNTFDQVWDSLIKTETFEKSTKYLCHICKNCILQKSFLDNHWLSITSKEIISLLKQIHKFETVPRSGIVDDVCKIAKFCKFNGKANPSVQSIFALNIKVLADLQLDRVEVRQGLLKVIRRKKKY